MKFRASEADLARGEIAKLRHSRQREILKAQARAKKSRPNSCLVFSCDANRSHCVVRPSYYANGDAHRIYMCGEHAQRLMEYWRRERQIDCYVERMA